MDTQGPPFHYPNSHESTASIYRTRHSSPFTITRSPASTSSAPLPSTTTTSSSSTHTSPTLPASPRTSDSGSETAIESPPAPPRTLSRTRSSARRARTTPSSRHYRPPAYGSDGVSPPQYRENPIDEELGAALGGAAAKGEAGGEGEEEVKLDKNGKEKRSKRMLFIRLTTSIFIITIVALIIAAVFGRIDEVKGEEKPEGEDDRNGHALFVPPER